MQSSKTLADIQAQTQRILKREAEGGPLPEPIDTWRAILDRLAVTPEGSPVNLSAGERAYLEQVAWRLWLLAKGTDFAKYPANRNATGAAKAMQLSAAAAMAKVPNALGLVPGPRKNGIGQWRTAKRAWKAKATERVLRGVLPAAEVAQHTQAAVRINVAGKSDPEIAKRMVRALKKRARD